MNTIDKKWGLFLVGLFLVLSLRAYMGRELVPQRPSQPDQGRSVPKVGFSDNPDLASLTLSAGRLMPLFNSAVINYTTNVGFLQTSIEVTMEPVEPTATVTVNDRPLAAKEGGTVLTSDAMSLLEGDNILTLRVITPGGASKTYNVTVTRQSASSFAQIAYLKASNTEEDDHFGYSVSLSGDTLAVGAPYEGSDGTGVNGDQGNNSAFGSGAVYVFVRQGAKWSQQAYLKASNTERHAHFGHSVSLSGETLAVGTPNEDNRATGVNWMQDNNHGEDSGAVYLFVRQGSIWNQQAYLKSSNTGVFDHFGYSVSLSGDTLAVGTPDEYRRATGVTGVVYLFVRQGARWRQQAYLKASNTEKDDHFGYSISLSEKTLAVGTHSGDSHERAVYGIQDDNNVDDSGAVYLFVRQGSIWSQQAYLKASNTEEDDHFGHSLSLSGDTLAVGAHWEDSRATGVNGNQGDNSAVNSGAVYLFVRQGARWRQQAYLKASNTGTYDNFGKSVSLSGERLAVGAYFEDSSATGVNGNQGDNSAGGSGAVYLFMRQNSIWSQKAYLKASNTEVGDFFGGSVSLSGRRLAVGAKWEDSSATGVNGNQGDNSADASGGVYLFRQE